MPTILSGQVDLGAATEAVALASNSDIASFTDNNLADTPSAFTAAIDWGDGTTSSGTVVGSNGSFTVEGGHIYADEGIPEATVTITRTADNTQIAPTGSVSVADSDNISVQGRTITGNPNQPLTNVTVATFTTSNTANTLGDFAVTIDWGDGTSTPGTVSGSNGSFTVQGSHTYTADGDDVITVFVNDDAPDAAFNSGTSQALIGVGFGGQLVLNSATEGQALGSGTTIATFADSNNADTAGDFTAAIDWGDGTTDAGTVVGANGSFSVQGDHTYADEASVLATVTITRTADSATTAPSGNVLVIEADLLTPTAKTIGGQPGVLINNVVVATFADQNTANVAGDFTATIDWGDGSSSVGTVSGSGATFSVSGSHTYATAGQDTISVTLTDDDPGTATATANSKAFIGFAAGDVLLTDATEGVALPGNTAVATFTDNNLSDTAGSFTAAIDWGDGTTTAGTIVGSNGSFTVKGGHAYADEAAGVPLTATITRISDSAVVVDTGSVAVAENDALTPHGTTISGSLVITNATVATFTDTNTGNVAGDFTATVDWGDGTTSAGTVTGSGATFSVVGSHTYATAGQDTLHVTLTDDAPGTATATATSTAIIGLTGQMVLTSATEHVTLPSNTVVATYVDGNNGDTAASFTATIDWGDGTTSAGTVSGASGSFTVSGGHTYADEGSLPVIATLVRTSDQEQGTSSGNVAVAEHDALSAQGTTLTGNQGQAFSNVVVATFTDTDAANVAGDFTAAVDWGDGTTTVGTVAGASGAFTVSGTHTYSTAGPETVTVRVADDAPGTATATATGAAAIAAVVPTKNDFNGDLRSDILWQNDNGTPATWLMNGTAMIGGAALPNPGPGWHEIGSGDFNGDGKADIVWQNDNGTPAIWLMNGTTMTGGTALPNPGAGWHVIGTGDFNGDGNSDILLRNDDGTPRIWLMNGTSIATATTLPNAGPSWHPIGTGDFNGDLKADILWQNDNGTPAIWLMNGTTMTGGAALPNPGPGWHAIGTGDFNGDLKADILWQNDNGTPAIWLMNGTTMTGGGVLPNPGAGWHVIGTDDFNGDHHADILLRHDDGTPQVWLMNGTSITTAAMLPDAGTSWHPHTG
jgi:hypothetical protein